MLPKSLFIVLEFELQGLLASTAIVNLKDRVQVFFIATEICAGAVTLPVNGQRVYTAELIYKLVEVIFIMVASKRKKAPQKRKIQLYHIFLLHTALDSLRITPCFACSIMNRKEKYSIIGQRIYLRCLLKRPDSKNLLCLRK